MKKSYGAEQVIGLLRQSEVLLSQGKSITEVCRQIGISDATYYKWRQHYNHIRPHSSLGYKPPAPLVHVRQNHSFVQNYEPYREKNKNKFNQNTNLKLGL